MVWVGRREFMTICSLLKRCAQSCGKGNTLVIVRFKRWLLFKLAWLKSNIQKQKCMLWMFWFKISWKQTTCLKALITLHDCQQNTAQTGKGDTLAVNYAVAYATCHTSTACNSMSIWCVSCLCRQKCCAKVKVHEEDIPLVRDDLFCQTNICKWQYSLPP